MRLYYLTGAAFALSNIALRRIKISRFSDLNDPFELLAVNLQDKEHRRSFRTLRDTLNESKGLLCLSRSWKNPLMWGHYAEKHTGIGLGFEVPDHLLNEVIYAKVPEVLPLDQSTGLPVPNESFINRLLRTKFYDWHYEDEMRIFVQLDPSTCEEGKFFYNFSNEFQLREVILGPRCELPVERVRGLVAEFDPKVSVIKSRIAFGSFDVVENRVFRADSA